MIIIPEEILHKQLCSSCLKYLSVGPIKVYPNRQVKCGRCSKENDGGTTSLLYQTIASCVLFPCINRFDGCKEVLSFAEMKYHENACLEDEKQCPICADFKGTAYNLNLHLHGTHQKDKLDASEFLIDFKKGDQQKIFFYRKDTVPCFVTYQYEPIVQKLYLKAAFTGKHYRGNVTQKFTLCNIENEIQHATEEEAEDFEFQIDLSELNFAQNIVICKFFMKEEPISELQQSPQFIDAMNDCAIIQCRFNNITVDSKEEIYYPGRFIINGLKFKVSILFRIDLNQYCVYLERSSIDQQKCFYVFAKFTVTTHSKQIFVTTEGQFNDEKYYLEGIFDNITNLFDPDTGVVENNTFLVEIRCQVKLNRKRKRSCVYCDSCKECVCIIK